MIRYLRQKPIDNNESIKSYKAINFWNEALQYLIQENPVVYNEDNDPDYSGKSTDEKLINIQHKDGSKKLNNRTTYNSPADGINMLLPYSKLYKGQIRIVIVPEDDDIPFNKETHNRYKNTRRRLFHSVKNPRWATRIGLIADLREADIAIVTNLGNITGDHEVPEEYFNSLNKDVQFQYQYTFTGIENKPIPGFAIYSRIYELKLMYKITLVYGYMFFYQIRDIDQIITITLMPNDTTNVDNNIKMIELQIDYHRSRGLNM